MKTTELFLDPRQLVQHERVQQVRLRRIAAQLAVDGMRVPVAVTPVDDGRHAVVDGAHRSTAAVLLGMPTIPCTVVPFAADAAIDGWTHLVRGLRVPAGGDSRGFTGSGAGPVVATIRMFGQRWNVRASEDSPAARHRAFHRVGALYGQLPYERVPRPVPGAWCQVTWRIPQWRELLDMVTQYGPLPAGVTRFDIAAGAGLPAAA